MREILPNLQRGECFSWDVFRKTRDSCAESPSWARVGGWMHTSAVSQVNLL